MFGLTHKIHVCFDIVYIIKNTIEVIMIHRFGISEGLGNEAFDAVHESFRSDIDQRHSYLSLHDPDSNDIKFARQLADEMINISGAEVKIFIRTDNGDYDAVWDEDPDPTYWNAIYLKGFFKPKPIETELTKWGLDTVNKTEIVFSHRQVYNLVGDRMFRPGDVIQLPFNAIPVSPKNYRILNSSPSGNFRYIWLYYTCQLELLTADINVRPEEDMLEEDHSNVGYKESL